MLPNHHLTSDDRAVLGALREGGADRLVVDDLIQGLRIEARSWAGLLRFPSFDLAVKPKLAGDNIGLVEMIAFTSGIEALRPTGGVRTLDAAGAHLLDLIGMLLVEACDSVLRKGLRADYVVHEAQLTTIRGRLLADRQMLRRFGQIDRLECRFDEHETNIPDNQLLCVALRECARRAQDPSVRQRATVLSGIFLQFCDIEAAELHAIRRDIVYSRLNEHYRPAHALSWLLLDGLGVDDVFATGRTDSFAFLIDMDLLFERFVLRLLEHVLEPHHYHITYQEQTASIVRTATGGPYASIRPDAVLRAQGTDRRLPVDAKYKTYDQRRVSTSDISQAFLYAYAYGRSSPTRAVLIYPASSSPGRVETLEVRSLDGLAAAELSAIGVHIPTYLAEVRSNGSGRRSEELRVFIERCMSN